MPCSPPGDLPNPGIEPRSPALQVDSLLSEPLGKSMNTGVGNLSLLQGIFPTQESNWGLLHCRGILYQLSYQGSPYIYMKTRRLFFPPSVSLLLACGFGKLSWSCRYRQSSAGWRHNMTGNLSPDSRRHHPGLGRLELELLRDRTVYVV